MATARQAEAGDAEEEEQRQPRPAGLSKGEAGASKLALREGLGGKMSREKSMVGG